MIQTKLRFLSSVLQQSRSAMKSMKPMKCMKAMKAMKVIKAMKAAKRQSGRYVPGQRARKAKASAKELARTKKALATERATSKKYFLLYVEEKRRRLQIEEELNVSHLPETLVMRRQRLLSRVTE